MTLLNLVILLILAGGGLYLVGLLPIDATIKRVIQVVVILVVVVYVVKFLFGGVLSGL